MKIQRLADARRFSGTEVQRAELWQEAGLAAELWCFEAGQRLEVDAPQGPRSYQVLEGEALLDAGGARHRLGKGRLAGLTADEAHALENAGGGLLVVLATRAA